MLIKSKQVLSKAVLSHFRGKFKTFALLFTLAFSLSLAISACSTPNNSVNSVATLNGKLNQQQANVIRIGYQKYGTLSILKARGGLEERLKPQGVSVQWTQFPAGPQLLEALSVGSIDFGHTGEAPPIFAQAAGVPLVYVASESPNPRGEAILVPRNSSINDLTGLKGKKVALNKGSNVHYLLLQALTASGLKYSDIQPVYLPPADARAAFAQGSLDAWVIWDPYLSAAQQATGARILKDAEGLAANREFYLASKSFSDRNSNHIHEIVEEVQKVDNWAKSNPIEVARLLSPELGIDVPILEEVSKKRSYQVQQITPEVIAYQQKVADAFYNLKLLPKIVKVSEVAQLPKQ